MKVESEAVEAGSQPILSAIFSSGNTATLFIMAILFFIATILTIATRRKFSFPLLTVFTMFLTAIAFGVFTIVSIPTV